jgi:hypothetical protein
MSTSLCVFWLYMAPVRSSLVWHRGGSRLPSFGLISKSPLHLINLNPSTHSSHFHQGDRIKTILYPQLRLISIIHRYISTTCSSTLPPATMNSDIINRSFTKEYNEVQKQYDEAHGDPALEKCLERTRVLLAECAIPRYHKIRTMLLHRHHQSCEQTA